MAYLVIINPLSYGIDAMRTIMLRNSYLQLYPLYINIIVLSAVIAVIPSLVYCFLIDRNRLFIFLFLLLSPPYNQKTDS